MSHLVFRTDELLSFYHCQEFFRLKKLEQQEHKGPEKEALMAYMEQVKNWAHGCLYAEESSFFGGDDEDSSVVLYSSSLNIYVSVFALRATSGTIDPIFLLKKIPEKIRDNHLIVSCLAIQALRDLGLGTTERVWLTTGTEHLPVKPSQENFDILNRVCSMMNEGYYQVKTGAKCRFCPAKDICEVYDSIEQIKSLCSSGPSTINL